MSKNLKLISIVAVLAIGVGGYVWYNTQKSDTTEPPAKTTDTPQKAVEDKAPANQEKPVQTQEAKVEPEKKPNVSAEKEEKVNPVSSDKLNSDPIKGKTLIVLKDGTKITEGDVKADLDNIPDQISGKMSLAEIKFFLAWKKAYDKVMQDVVSKSNIKNSENIKELLAKRMTTAAGFLLLDEEAKKLMTTEALKKHYDKIWDKNFKGTKEFSLVAITTADKNIPEQIKKTVKDQESLKKFLEANPAVKSMDMDSRPQAIFPPEIADAVLKQGVNAIIGPFEVKGSIMLFFVKSIDEAKKKEFTEEFAEEYKKVAVKDFVKEYLETLYKKYNIEVFDANNKVVDPFNIIDKNKKEPDQKALANLAKFKDDAILAKTSLGNVTVKDVKDFFKVKSLLDETFVSMAKQLNISPEDVIVYAVKLVVDDKVLAAEVSERKYDSREDVKSKLQEVENMELNHAYFKENTKITSEDTKRTFEKFIKAIPEEDKNDNEISVKLAFFPTQEEAGKTLQSIQNGEEKFGSLYKYKSEKKEATDLGYVKKQAVAPDLWKMLKTGASGACCKQIIQLNGEQFGAAGKNFAIVYVADRRPVTLPSLSNEAEKKYFQRLAEREKAVELVKSYFLSYIKTVEGKPINEIIKASPEQIDRIISVLLGYAG